MEFNFILKKAQTQGLKLINNFFKIMTTKPQKKITIKTEILKSISDLDLPICAILLNRLLRLEEVLVG